MSWERPMLLQDLYVLIFYIYLQVNLKNNLHVAQLVLSMIYFSRMYYSEFKYLDPAIMTWTRWSFILKREKYAPCKYSNIPTYQSTCFILVIWQHFAGSFILNKTECVFAVGTSFLTTATTQYIQYPAQNRAALFL